MPCDFLNIQAYDNIVLARVEKDRLVDGAAINALGEDLLKLLDRYPRISLVLDLEAVQALSSAMLGYLIKLHKGVVGFKGRMTIAGAGPKIMPIFTVTKLDKLLTMSPTAQEAILLYKRKPL